MRGLGSEVILEMIPASLLTQVKGPVSVVTSESMPLKEQNNALYDCHA